jgi:hypothetical protein
MRTFSLTLPGIIVTHRILDRVPSVIAWILAVATMVVGLRGARRLGSARTLLLLGTVVAYVVVADGFEPGALRRYLFPVWILSLMSVALAVDRDDGPRRWPLRVGSLKISMAGLLTLGIVSIHLVDGARLLQWDRATEPVPSYVGACRAVAPVLDAILPANARIASFDSGSLGYFSPRPVVNLDGLVNDDIRGLRRTCSGEPYESCLLRYLREKRVTVLVGGTAFSWTEILPDWATWARLYSSASLAGDARLVVLRVPE